VAKVSIMESNDDLRAQLREAERGEAASWVTYDAGSWWEPPLFGLWAAALVLSLGYLDGQAQALANLALVGFSFAFIWWQRRVRGVYPVHGAPREFGRSSLFFFPGVAVLVLAASVVYFLVEPWLAAVVVALATWAFVEVYGRLYEADAARVRRRIDGGA
jgi:hypothetical protein